MLNYIDNKAQATSNKLATTVGLFFFFYMILTLKTFIWFDHLGFFSAVMARHGACKRRPKRQNKDAAGMRHQAGAVTFVGVADIRAKTVILDKTSNSTESNDHGRNDSGRS